MPGFRRSLWKQGQVTLESPAASKAHKISPIMMDSFMQGPIVVHLAPGTPYDPAEISAYITAVLQYWNTDNSYGLLAGITENGGPIVPTLIFGIPQRDVQHHILPPTPYDLPILVKEDSIVTMTGFGTIWNKVPVHNPEKISLEAVSVGVEGSLETAGSFGGFLRHTASPADIFGITAALCFDEATVGSPVCIPSTVEVTGRLNRLLRYTMLCPLTDRLHINQLKDTEAKSLLQRFAFIYTPLGTLILDPAEQFQPKKGILQGRHIGHIVYSQFGNQAGLLHDYDRRLESLGEPTFMADPSWVTRMDYSIFSCNPARCDGNIYEGEAIEETGVLYPGAVVEKIGRTNGTCFGFVNGFYLQRWHSARPTHEIAITGDVGIPFALVGDSGGCVLVNMNGVYRAAGILIGKNQKNDFALVTPLDLILASAPGYQWASDFLS